MTGVLTEIQERINFLGKKLDKIDNLLASKNLKEKDSAPAADILKAAIINELDFLSNLLEKMKIEDKQ